MTLSLLLQKPQSSHERTVPWPQTYLLAKSTPISNEAFDLFSSCAFMVEIDTIATNTSITFFIVFILLDLNC